MKYSNKIIKKEFNEQIIKAAKLHPLKQQTETFKLAKVLAPFSGSVLDGLLSKDRSLVCASAMTLLASNATEEHFESLQILLLGSLLGVDDEPLTTPEQINAWLESHPDISGYDLLLWLGQENFYTPLTKVAGLSSLTPMFNTVKGLFNGLVEQHVEGGEDVQEATV